jgi:hypothetical protein
MSLRLNVLHMPVTLTFHYKSFCIVAGKCSRLRYIICVLLATNVGAIYFEFA